MTREMAILWIHETVGDRLDGEATLEQCCKWIAWHGTASQRVRLERAVEALDAGK